MNIDIRHVADDTIIIQDLDVILMDNNELDEVIRRLQHIREGLI